MGAAQRASSTIYQLVDLRRVSQSPFASVSPRVNWTLSDNLHCLPHGKGANGSGSQEFPAETV